MTDNLTPDKVSHQFWMEYATDQQIQEELDQQREKHHTTDAPDRERWDEGDL